MSEYFGKDTKKLGFGLMRLPRKLLFTDIEETKRMVDLFMEAGFTYYDTAFVYPGSEAAAKKALVDRYPRESYTLADKLMAPAAPNEKAAKQQFYTSLERTGAGYFDYYLLHSIMESNYRRYERFNLWDYALSLKEKGLIRHLGFSFHEGPELLDRLLREHPEVEFVQLQINYQDWEDKSIVSRANYECARAHGKSIVIMEPVKGGKLADPPKEVKKLLLGYAPEASFASWAIRFAAGLDGVITVLSGMSTAAQMQDNLSYMRDFKPLCEEEQRIIHEAQRILGNSATVPCTACRYCCAGCPKSIPIPDVFSALNIKLGSGQTEEAKAKYAEAVKGGSPASECIECGRCEKVCPQHIEVTRKLKQAARMLEN